ncbi:addiction module protein [Rhodopirellula bahusiensis]|uniref:addiction module protein n=1 Tax=Rhodopirellula bahusiensis TaxID=2014065 RepID=UPI003265E595
MDTQSQQLLATALGMPESDRATLAASLLRSLDPADDPLADAAWAAEIERRIESIDNGTAELRPWDDVMSEMRQRRSG